MQALQKLASLFIFFIILFLQPFGGSFKDNKTSMETRELNPKLLYEIKLHGFLLWVSTGLLMPVGILTIRMSNREQSERRLKILFYIHVISQMIAVILATSAAVMSIKNFNNSINNYHQRIGVGLYGIIWLQALMGFLRPQRGCKGRSIWFFGHWLLGTAIALLGTINIYTGLHAYNQKTSRSITLWSLLFTIEISCIAFFYLLQDKWLHIKKKEKDLGDESIRPTENSIGTRVSTGDKEPKEYALTDKC